MSDVIIGQFGQDSLVYPMMDDYADADHPLISELEAHPITSVKVGVDWTDDHCFCCNLIIEVNGTKYGVSTWWLSRTGERMVYCAEAGEPNQLKKLRKHLLEAVDF